MASGIEKMGPAAGLIARKLHLDGVVQGVGFRPLVYRLAGKYRLTGWVLNSSEGLEVWVEGYPTAVEAFCQEILNTPPRLAHIVHHAIREEKVRGYPNFEIRHSWASERKEVLISPDVAICEDCLREVLDPEDRRYQYPFTNCTHCGPRYTIIQDVPYDRKNTTMHRFPMCARCQAEYEDPGHRRFHAQPNACPVCGPTLQLLGGQGREVIEPEKTTPVDAATRLREVRRILQAGSIVAVKGLGGFHLACDALNPAAVQRLRQSKRREDKPFALMARDLSIIEKYATTSETERKLLLDPAAPIVILDLTVAAQELPLEFLAPGLSTLAFMLPYTPLHYLLFGEALELLVMTSANLSDDPLVTENQEALARLEGIADYYLLHDRDIHSRCDDSLVRVVAGNQQFYRRARGYVPLPVPLGQDGPVVLAVGGELKNTFCLTRKREAYLSQHLGDLNHWGNYQQFLTAIPLLEKMLEVTPDAVAYDLHPDYAATRYARGRRDLIQVGVQHHHAHLAACLAESGETRPVLGVICDGTGYGTDGTIWGFELLLGDHLGFSRLASLRPIALPGGEATIRRPGRMALTYLWQYAGSTQARKWAAALSLGLAEEEVTVLLQQLEKGLNTWITTSGGRLFDAVSALLGVCTEISYEGQAAVELETLASGVSGDRGFYPFPLVKAPGFGASVPWEKPWITWPETPKNGQLKPNFLRNPESPSPVRYWLDTSELWAAILRELQQGVDREIIAYRFHGSVVQGIVNACQRLRAETGVSCVALSGGVFHNRILLSGLKNRLTTEGLEVLLPQQVPPNDGGLSLGQAVVARAVLKSLLPKRK
ncbi:MAG: carbamoyltransferase HypF [Syntrophomonadaceae bacterium]|nr:carbamoyltransferase HypF [Syntrophomonadaceae bacterium]